MPINQMRLSFASSPGSEEVGPRGLTYDETSVVYSLLWNQPSLQPSPHSYSRRRANPLVRRGGQSTLKTTGVGLPIFYTESPDHPINEGDERGEETEIREAVCSLFTHTTD